MRRSRPSALPLVSSLITPSPPPGGLYPQGVVSVRPPRLSTAPGARRGSVEQGRLGGGGGRRAAALRLLRAALGLALGGGRRPRQLPALLVRDALALLDHQQVDEARQRIAQEA